MDCMYICRRVAVRYRSSLTQRRRVYNAPYCGATTLRNLPLSITWDRRVVADRGTPAPIPTTSNV